MKRISLSIGLSLLLALIFTVPSLAGGWAVITLDELPGQVVEGEPLEIGFMVRQHGMTPMKGLSPIVHARVSPLGKSITFIAEEKGEAGHYVATLTLPEAGEWQWSIEAFTGNQPMPALTVVAGPVVAERPVQAQTTAETHRLEWAAGLLGATAVLVGLFIIFQRKARWAIALVLAGLLVSAGSIVSAADQPAAQAESSLQADAEVLSADVSVSQVDLGRDLFIAKGCMLCHSHVETNKVREYGVDIGPDLTNLTARPEYLRMWLKDPAGVKSTAQMPTLDLSDAEIEALIAFINSD